MEIIVGKKAGFCYGVKNVVEESTKILNKEDTIYCLGELVHNKQVMDELKNNGLIVVEDINDIPNGNKVIFRAHGICKEIYNIADEKDLEIIDLTCPSVLAIHKKAEKYSNDGYVILIGEKQHPETIGTKSFAKKGYVIENEEDIESAIENFKESSLNKIYIIAQTTFSLEKFDSICKKINELLTDTEIIVDKTICNATKLRQEETEEMAKNVELMIIIGGKNSANTKKLYDISLVNCKNAILVQTKDEIDIEFVHKFKKVGIMAGASTPDKSIQEIIEYIK